VQFYHPSYLYFLFLLVIPIIVHFFQLRKFKKQEFTNVAFLKKVQIQARKSSTIKKWLILFSRLLALAALVIAFAQPFIPQGETALQPQENVIYLDNSYSMQMPGRQGSLLKGAVQQLLEQIPGDQEITLFTNDQTFKNTPLSQIKNDLLQLDYTPENMGFKTALFKAKQSFSDQSQTNQNFIALSDFQQFNLQDLPGKGFKFKTFAVQLKPESFSNISVDSLSVKQQNTGNYEMNITISSSEKITRQVPVSAFNGKTLLAKSSAVFEDTNEAKLRFNFEEPTIENGRIQIQDEGLKFDNDLFFNLAPPAQLNVVAISKADDRFLAKIFKDDTEFKYKNFEAGQVDYNQLEEANFIVLNEMENIPAGLQNLLQNHRENGGTLCIIPGPELNLKNYNSLLSQLNAPNLGQKQKRKLKISNINFDHPLLDGVFNSRIQNFQYPEVNLYFPLQGNRSSVLNYNNKRSFLYGNSGIYLFSAPLEKEVTNFKQSPLIVPAFYNMARQSLKPPNPYFILGRKNSFDVRADLTKDEVLHLKNETEDYIPQQRKFNAKVSITAQNIPKKAGNYQLTQQKQKLRTLSFNHDRKENKLIYARVDNEKRIETKENIAQLFSDLKNENEIDEFWKWFVIFAAIFLITEMLLLKFLK
jgi:hypothetical protein